MHRRVAGSLAVTGAYGNPREARGLDESLWNVGGVCVGRCSHEDSNKHNLNNWVRFDQSEGCYQD